MRSALKSSKPKAKARAKPARLPSYRPEITKAICKRLIERESLRSICRDPKMPAASTVFEWLADPAKADFRAAYEAARGAQADALFDEMLDIADDASNDWMKRKGENGEGYELNGDHVQRTRLRIDARKWVLARMAPKKYGDRIAHEHGGTDGGPIQSEVLVRPQITREEWLRIHGGGQ